MFELASVKKIQETHTSTQKVHNVLPEPQSLGCIFSCVLHKDKK
jgi:hypothetical protein